MRNSENLDNVLDTLDPQQHSLGVLVIYLVKFMMFNQNAGQPQAVQMDPEQLISVVAQFFTVCNGEHIRFAPEMCMFHYYIKNVSIQFNTTFLKNLLSLFIVAELCHLFTQCVAEREMPARGIAPLCRAIQKARMNEMQLTSIHADLLRLCLMSKNLKPALEFLNADITDINTEVCTA